MVELTGIEPVASLVANEALLPAELQPHFSGRRVWHHLLEG